jgi:DNA mismatch repair protein MutL
MGIIQVLDETLSNQIAAGEVVERPASVAKELLENALDAGATAIGVEIVGGGIERLRITDNGRGMSPEDAVVALERHATSKVRTSEDLGHITTLGFRGEALPSIASVSRFRVRTREPHALGATVVAVEGGHRRAPTESAGPPGTEVLVEDLFFNVPARRKFLKRAETEAAHIQDVVTQLALAWPQIAFRVVKDGRTALDLPRHDTLADRVRALFGRETGDRLRPVTVAGAFSMEGLIGLPTLAFGSPRHLHCFINGRYIRDRVVVGAVQAAYAGALEKGRYPFVVVHLRMPPEALDVNVHPAKTEVRFVDSGSVHRFIHRNLVDVLRSDAPVDAGEGLGPLLAPPPSPGTTPAPEPPPTRQYSLAPEAPPAAPTTATPETPDAGLDAHRRRIFDAMERLGARRAVAGPAAPAVQPAPRPVSEPATSAEPEPDPEPERPLPPTHRPELSPLSQWRPIATLTPRLGLALAAEALVLLDLPAARRALFLHRLRAGAAPIRLGAPVVVDLGPADARRLEANASALARAGFDLEPFGGGSFVVKTLPAGLEGCGAVDALLRRALAETPEGMPARLAHAVVEAAPAAPTPAELLALLRALAPFEAAVPRWATLLGHGELERRLARGVASGDSTP